MTHSHRASVDVDIRLEAARRMLTTSDLSAAEIGACLRLSDALPLFCRIFRTTRTESNRLPLEAEVDLNTR